MSKTIHKSSPLDNQFSFYTRENMKNYVKIQEAQFQNYISLYGIELEYFARNIDYYDSKGNIKYLFNRQGRISKGIRDFSYFTGPECYGFKAMLPIRAIVDYGMNNFMFTGFGLDNTNDGKFYITKRQFNQACLQFFGLPKNETVGFSVELSILNWKNITTTSFKVPFKADGDLTYMAEVEFPKFDIRNLKISDSLDINPDFIKGFKFPVSDINPEYTTYFQNNKFIEFDEDSLEVYVSDINYNKFGSGKIKLFVHFDIAYNSFKFNNNCHYETYEFGFNEYTGEHLNITFVPKVGDFIRLRLLDDPTQFRDYQIEFVNDVNFDKDSISPYITNFCWECSITRRKPSHEIVDIMINNYSGEKVPPMEKGIESVIDNRQNLLMQDITREEELYDYNKKFEDVNGELIENLDYRKDAIFGSLNDPDENQDLRGSEKRRLKSVKGRQLVPVSRPKELQKE